MFIIQISLRRKLIRNFHGGGEIYKAADQSKGSRLEVGSAQKEVCCKILMIRTWTGNYFF